MSLLVPVKSAQLIQVAKLQQTLGKPCSCRLCKRKVRVQRQVVELERRYITLSVNGDFKYRNESMATRKFQSFVRRDRMEV